jgi:hypothetical protein
MPLESNLFPMSNLSSVAKLAVLSAIIVLSNQLNHRPIYDLKFSHIKLAL